MTEDPTEAAIQAARDAHARGDLRECLRQAERARQISEAQQLRPVVPFVRQADGWFVPRLN